MVRIAPEGYPFIGVFAALTLLAFIALGPLVAAAPLALGLFMVYFFRDPERRLPAAEGYVSPADGRVVSIAPQYERQYLKRNTMRISIFMSPLNVHVNRSPCDGEVMSVRHTPGSLKAAYKESASLKNENTAMILREKDGEVLVRQVAGFLARRVVCRVGPGDRLKRGQRFGIIKLSSRLDVYLPLEVDIVVKPSETVRAGETLLASPKERK
ncbi:MAG: phosphatidylserine decarboxylase family protein [Nitrospirota bacterium]|jgi:phosphatidylserine decarboxylase